jgi:hypothetical protein
MVIIIHTPERLDFTAEKPVCHLPVRPTYSQKKAAGVNVNSLFLIVSLFLQIDFHTLIIHPLQQLLTRSA